MLYRTNRSVKLPIKYVILLSLLTVASAKPGNTDPEKNNATQSESLQSAASEHVEKILNVPVTLNFDDEPLIRRGRGFYGGHRRNDEEEQKINDGQFGARIILGIVHHDDKTSTTTPIPDQKKSQTIVKYFDKEDYDGIKTNPIVVDDPYEDTDDNQNEKTRNRKEILALKQKKSPLVDHEERPQENKDDSVTLEENENEDLKEASLTGDDERTENNEERNNQQQNAEYEDEGLPEKQEEEPAEDPAKYTREDDDAPTQKYKVPPNHKETYTEVEYPEDYHRNHQEEESEKLTHSKEPIPKNHDDHFHQEEPSAKLTFSKETSLKDEDEPKHHHHRESLKASDVKERLSQKDQKGNADHSHEEVKKKKKKGGKHASGKGEEKHEEHHGAKGDKGEKKYKGYHEEVKGKKGHNDEEKHGKKYADKGGEEKKHHEEHGHHGDYHKGEKGEKGSKFSEEGKHSKGHSTKGEHNIHKKDEYEKNQEFYDEHHEGGEHEKHGGFHHEDHYKKGGHKKVGHHKKGDHEDHYGKKSHHEEGHFYDEKDGKKKATGHNQHHSHHAKHGKKSGNSGRKHWGYKKGNGGGGQKKHKEGQHVAHSNLQQVKKPPPAVHEHYKEEGKYPHYIGRFHVRNDNRRSDTVDDKEEITVNQEVKDPEAKQNLEQTQEKDKDFNSDTKETEEHTKQLRDSNSNENEEIRKEEDTEDEELDHEHLPQSSVIHEKSKDSPKNSSKPLPKIYVILPKDFEEQLQRSAESPDSSSIEGESSYEDSEEEKDEPKIRAIHKKYTKVVEPVEAQSFPEEHKKRLSEIEYVIHKIGAGLGKNMKDKSSQVKVKSKPRKEDGGESDKFSFSGSSEEA